MTSFNGNYIEYPDRYYAAKEARIRANANLTRSRKLDAAIAGESEEFRCWLRDTLPTSLEALRVASGAEWTDSNYTVENGPANQAYKAAWKLWIDRNPKLPEWMRESLQQWGGLTDKQLAVAKRIWAEHAGKLAKRDAADAERRANATAWTTGRQIVTGTIQSTKVTTNDFGTTFKMILQTASGSRLWTSIPRALLNDRYDNLAELKGQTVTIKVTVEPSKDDPTFAFGSRPNVAA